MVVAGLEAYRNTGLDQAFRAWLRDSPLHWDPAMAAPLHQAQEEYGVYRGFEVIDMRSLAPSTQIAYVLLDYDRGPVFGKFVAYRTEQQGWVVTSLKFSLDEDAILPSSTL